MKNLNDFICLLVIGDDAAAGLVRQQFSIGYSRHSPAKLQTGEGWSRVFLALLREAAPIFEGSFFPMPFRSNSGFRAYLLSLDVGS